MISTARWVGAAARLRVYAANDEPLAAAGNKVSLVLAGNTPFYPLYVAAVAGTDGMPWLLMTLFAFPFFLMVPAISRHYPFLGRATLALAGAINTVFCTWLLGERSGTELFLIPCAMLASLLFGAKERQLDADVGCAPAVRIYLFAWELWRAAISLSGRRLRCSVLHERLQCRDALNLPGDCFFRALRGAYSSNVMARSYDCVPGVDSSFRVASARFIQCRKSNYPKDLMTCSMRRRAGIDNRS